jgi:hypothetical protein
MGWLLRSAVPGFLAPAASVYFEALGALGAEFAVRLVVDGIAD